MAFLSVLKQTCQHVGWKTAIGQNVRQTIELLGQVQDAGRRPAIVRVPADPNGE